MATAQPDKRKLRIFCAWQAVFDWAILLSPAFSSSRFNDLTIKQEDCDDPQIACCDGRVVKALDLKSNGIFPRRFEPCSQRIFWMPYRAWSTKPQSIGFGMRDLGFESRLDTQAFTTKVDAWKKWPMVVHHTIIWCDGTHQTWIELMFVFFLYIPFVLSSSSSMPHIE